MRRVHPALLAIVALLCVAAGWKAFLSPGPTVDSHEDFSGDCDQCHLAFAGLPDEKCLTCHEGVAEREAKGMGFHASVAKQPCIDCHTDHHGADAHATKDDARKAFTHDLTGFGLSGGHGPLKCDECHTKGLEEMSATCLGCHVESDPHDSALGPNCELCHGAAGWNKGVKQLADHGIAMDGGHDGLTCDDCHLHGNHLSDTTTCHACHDEGHGGTDAACGDCHQVAGWKPAEFDHGPCTCAFPGKHQTVGCLECHADFDFHDTPTRCEGCHEPKHEPLGGCAACHTATSWKDGRFDHNKQSAFALTGEHLAVSCVQCHTKPGEFRGAPTTCEGCHSDDIPHPEFGACADCHVVDGFAPSTFDHASTGFPLEGKHGALDCAECH